MVDIAVDNIEITQGIQTPDNTVPLVADRSTAVRVTLKDLDGGEPAGITGTLFIFVTSL